MFTDHSQTPVLSIRWKRLSFFLCSVPLLAIVSCVLIALVWHFDETTRTQCNVPNYLPSVSAVIGGEMPEKFIWRTAIALHCLPCIVLSVSVIHKYYKNTELGRRYNSATWWFGPLNLLNCISHLGENGALITLSYISSTDNLAVHEGSFIVFTLCVMLSMFLGCILFRLTANKPMNVQDYTLFRRKIFIVLFNYCTFGLLMYLFFRHEWYCEPGNSSPYQVAVMKEFQHPTFADYKMEFVRTRREAMPMSFQLFLDFYSYVQD